MAITILFVISLLVRLVGANQSFWLDEAASWQLARLPLGEFFSAVKNDFHPPLFYLLLHFWLKILQSLGEVGLPLADKTEWLIRLPNILAGAASAPLLFLLLKRLLPKEKTLPWLAALLLALNPLAIYYSIELRMYILSGLLSLLSWYFLVGALKGKGNREWYLFTAASVLNFYTFYGAFFNLFSQWLFVFFLHKKEIKNFSFSNGVLLLFFLPLLPTFLKQIEGGGYLRQVLPSWSDLSGTLSPKALGLIMAKFSFGRISLVNKYAYGLFVIGISVYFLFVSVLAWLKKENRLFHFWFYGSLLAAIIIGLTTPVLGYWRFVFLLPPFVTLFVLGLSLLPKDAFFFNLFVVFVVFVFGLFVFWTTPAFHREDWRKVAQVIRSEDSLTIVNFPEPFAPLRYYAPEVFYYPSQESLGKTRTDLDETLPALLSDRKTVFVLDYLSDLTDKKRTTLVWLKQAGLIEKKVHNINGVGFIYEYSVP